MCKSILVNRTIASVFFLFFLVVGCEEAAQPPVKPTVVKKRISEKSLPSAPEKADKPASSSVKSTTTQTKADPAQPQKEGFAAQEQASKTETPPHKTEEPVAADATPGETKTVEISLTEKIEDTGPRYTAEGKIDPFAPVFKDTPDVPTEAKEKKELPKRPLTPLEKIDISQLKLVAIIRAASGNRAMVEDATGKGYVIINGSYVGRKGGRVVQIDKDRAFIEEEAEDIFGKNTVSRRELKLQKPPGEE